MLGLTGVARKTVAGCVERINQLYEQGSDGVRIGKYVRAWLHWPCGGLAHQEAAVGGTACDELSVRHGPFDAECAFQLRHRPKQRGTT